MTTIQEIYDSPIVSEEKEFWDVSDWIFPDAGYCSSWENNTRLVLRTHFFHNFDGNRTMSIYSVLLDGKPFMAATGGGRSQRDSRETYVTDKDAYWKAIQYIKELDGQDDSTPTCSPSDEIEMQFYSYKVLPSQLGRSFVSISQHYDRRNAGVIEIVSPPESLEDRSEYLVDENFVRGEPYVRPPYVPISKRTV